LLGFLLVFVHVRGTTLAHIAAVFFIVIFFPWLSLAKHPS
jgi:hypothetical protein